jgi:hypothetical protein
VNFRAPQKFTEQDGVEGAALAQATETEEVMGWRDCFVAAPQRWDNGGTLPGKKRAQTAIYWRSSLPLNR